MAAEAQAEGPAPAPPPPLASRASPSPEKRVLPGDGAEEERRLPDSKRRRACVAALDSVPCAAASAEEVARPGSGCDADGASFSCGFVALETTPKFGSFNPPGAAEEAATLDLKPAQPDADGDGSPEADHEVPAPAASACGAEEQGVEVDGQGIEIAW
uniref:Uncharacterized protein n=1 Tax=Arundo donax TaxID=35708 RepID=A0A0A9D6V5_ARUDO